MRQFAALLVLLCLCCGARAEPVLRALAVLEDRPAQATIEEIAARPAGDFRPLPAGEFAGGFTRSAFWFRFEVAGRGEHWLDLLPPVLDDLRLYEATAAGWHERRAGDTLPFAVREVPYRGFVFKLRHEDDAPRTYYLRLQTTSSAALNLRLWRPEDFFARATMENGFLLAALAVVAAMIVINIYTWHWLREPLVLWFIGHIAAFGLHLLGSSGYFQQYLTPEHPAASYPYMAVTSFLLIASANGFYRRLFGIERNERFLFWLYEANFWLPLAALPIALAGHFSTILPPFLNMSLVMIGVGVVMALRQWRRRMPGGGMMLVANFTAFAGLIVFIANVLGLIAGGFFVWHSLQLSSLAAMIALQVAVGSRIRALREAQISAESQARHEREERLRQGQFLAMLGHELRTSLAVLKMAIGMQPMTPKTLASAERAMDGMGEVIDRSLAVQRLADGKFQPLIAPCDLAGLIEDVVADSRAPERVRIELAARPTVQTDGKLLRIVLVNLIDNALKYGAPDQPVEVVLTPGERWTIQIKNAIGPMGSPDPGRVFEKYYRAPAAHAQTGSGLGLYLARSLAALIGGELVFELESERVCFALRL